MPLDKRNPSTTPSFLHRAKAVDKSVKDAKFGNKYHENSVLKVVLRAEPHAQHADHLAFSVAADQLRTSG